MTLQLLVNGTDFTASWRVYESSWTLRAWQGEASQSEFLIDDPDGSFTHDNFAARKIVEVWEDASGTPICLYRGRIANKSLGMGNFDAPGHAMRWTLQVEDYNIELRGIRVINATRPEETDYDRAEAIRQAYLRGASSTHAEARNSTDLEGLYIGPTPGDAFTLDAETYTDTDPFSVLTRMTEMDGHVFFVYLQNDGTGALAYMGRDDMALLSTIDIVDDGADEGADGTDVYAAYKTPQAGDHAGQNVLTGAGVRYGDGSYFEESNVSGREDVYDKWEQTFTNDLVTSERSADLYTNTIIAANDESNTYMASIDIRPANVHRLKAGMMVPLIRKRANKHSDAAARAVVVTYNPIKPNADGETLYRLDVELGRPQFTRTIPPNRRRIPRPAVYNPGGDDAFVGAACSNTASDFDSDYPPWAGDKEERVQITALVDVHAGESLIAVATDVDEGHSGYDHLVYDEQGNTWTLDATSDAQGTADRRCHIYRCNVTNAIEAGEYIRFAFNIGGGGVSVDTGGRCLGVYKFAGTLSSPSVGVDNNAFNSTPTLASSAVGDVTVMGMSMRDETFTGDADWLDMVPYTQVSGSGNLAQGVWGQHLKPGAGESWTGSIDQNRDWTAISVGYDFAGGGGGGSGSGDVGAVGGPDDVAVGAPQDPPRYIPVGSVLEHLSITNGGPYHMAEDVTIADSGGYYTSGNVEGALQEIGAGGIGGGSLEVAEQDGSPDVSGVTRIELDGPGLTNDGGGQVTISAAAAVHSHVPPSGDGFRGVSLRRTTDFTSTNANTSIPDFDAVEYDTDGFYDAGDPERITIPAAFDGLMFQFYAMGLWATNTDNYTEMKLYRNGTAVEAPIAVTQHIPATAYNTGQEIITRPIQVATGDYFTITFRTPANETVLTYDDMSLVFAGWMVGGGVVLSDDTPLVESGSGAPGTSGESSRSDHVHPEDGGGGGGGVPPAILLESGHAVPFTFDEILQESDGSDFLWASE